jgi:hypothetical protein
LLPQVGRLLQALLQNPAQLHAFRVLLGLSTHPALPPLQPLPAEHTTPAAPAAGGRARAAGATSAGGGVSDGAHGGDLDGDEADPPSYAAGREIVSGPGTAAAAAAAAAATAAAAAAAPPPLQLLLVVGVTPLAAGRSQLPAPGAWPQRWRSGGSSS